MTLIAQNIGTQHFQLSTVGVGALAVGAEDIKQCIDIILRTIPGTDPMRPLFGCNAYKFIDKPHSITIPNIKKEVFEALGIWEPRIEVLEILHNIVDESQLAFKIVYRIIDSDIVDSVIYQNGYIASEQSSSGAIILTATIPSKGPNGVYNVVFLVNEAPASPLVQPNGFISAAEMLSWINNNWFNYGRWYLTANELVVYLNAGVANKAFLNITERTQVEIKTLIPELSSGSSYDLTLVLDGVEIQPKPITYQIKTIESLLLWLNNNWQDWGQWSITSEEFVGTSEADFNSDFGGDFSNGDVTQVLKYLVFRTQGAHTVNLTFN